MYKFADDKVDKCTK